MKCPVCNNVDLAMSDRNGIEIDYCPSCRGVWLDRGELDKIIERSMGNNDFKYEKEKKYSNDTYAHNQSSYQNHNNQYGNHNPHYKKKKEGFLADMFDFDF